VSAEPTLTRNARRCDLCGTVVESTHRHDYRVCGCENHTMVDGGLAYLRWGAVDPHSTTDLSEWTS
jgi:hypothetical protein